MKIYFNKKKIDIKVRKLGFFGKGTGLMFKFRNTENLLFEFRKPGRHAIHSFFVFFPFLALWLDEKNRVLERKIVFPFKATVKPKKEFYKLIEIPVNRKNSRIIGFFVDKGKV
jgi:uncharacterized membrane protein (UPF0127 family)